MQSGDGETWKQLTCFKFKFKLPIVFFSRFNLETFNHWSPSRPYHLSSFSLKTPNRRSGSFPTHQFFPVGLCPPGAQGSFLWRYAIAISHNRRYSNSVYVNLQYSYWRSKTMGLTWYSTSSWSHTHSPTFNPVSHPGLWIITLHSSHYVGHTMEIHHDLDRARCQCNHRPTHSSTAGQLEARLMALEWIFCLWKSRFASWVHAQLKNRYLDLVSSFHSQWLPASHQCFVAKAKFLVDIASVSSQYLCPLSSFQQILTFSSSPGRTIKLTS